MHPPGRDSTAIPPEEPFGTEIPAALSRKGGLAALEGEIHELTEEDDSKLLNSVCA